jgi:ribosomal protein S18 acetylase RimI-like enzyme
MIMLSRTGTTKRTAQSRQEQGESKVNIRPFNYVNGDYESAIAVENAINPDNPSSVEGWQHWDQNREEKYLFRRYLAEKEGQVIAVGAIGHTGWSYHPDKYFLDISVHPQEQGQGIGRAFYRFLVDELEALAPTKLVAFTRENRTRAIRFLEERGFAAVMRMPVSRLDPTTFDADSPGGLLG